MPAAADRPRNSLTRQFAVAAALLAALAVVLIAAGSWWWIERLQRESVRALLRKDAEQHAAQVSATLTAAATRLTEMAASPLITTALTDSFGREAYLQPSLGGLQAINTIPVDLLFVDFSGQTIARNGDGAVFNEDEMAWLRQRIEQGEAGAALFPSAGGDRLLVAEMVRYRRTNTVEGALLLRMPTAQLMPEPGFQLRPVSTTAPASDGKVISEPVALPALLQPLAFEVARADADLPRPPLGSLPWALLGLGGVLVLSVLALGRRLALRLTADLRRLERFARAVADQGFGSERANDGGPQEVQSLAQSVNQMLDRLNEHRAHEQHESQAQLRLLAACIEHLNDIVMVTEARPIDGPGPRILFVNDAFERRTGYRRDEVIGRTPRLLQGPGTSRTELDRIRTALEQWLPVRAELLNYRKDGSPFWVELEIVPIADGDGTVRQWVSVERDISERKDAEAARRSLEEQVRQAQKMEAIGTLAGGVAHDFNNILGAILGHVTLAQDDLETSDATSASVRSRLEQVRRSACRARDLVDQILAFSRRQPQQLRLQPLRPLVEETVALLRATVPARVQLSAALAEEPLQAEVDATGLQQVLMNLGTNAWHALQGSTGTVSFGLSNVHLPASGDAPVRPPGLPDGPYAVLSVADNGSGMDAATQARIFEPFFTTKPVGSGTGLGLSVVHGIVQSHGGAIGLLSAPGAGTTFHVWLPLRDAPVTGTASAHDVPAPRRGRGQRVLYVDDDEVMVPLAESLLQRWGYSVTALGDARAALELVRRDPSTIDVVITDFNMPELSGLDLMGELARLRPTMPVILTSGYLPDDVREQALHAGARGLLRKEHLHDELAPLLDRVLQGG